MDTKTENPLYPIARRYALELDITHVVMVEQAVKLYKSLHSKQDWLDRYHKECQSVNFIAFDSLTNEEFFDAVLTSEIWHLLEMKLGAPKSAYLIAQNELECMEKELNTGNYVTIFGIYPRKAWEKLLHATKQLHYPWLSYQENLLLLLMVAYHKTRLN